MKVPESALTGDAGVALVNFLVTKRLGWLFRSQPEADKGIDAHIEVVEDGVATGRLVALQVKSGKSSFNEPKADGFVFRPKANHVKYWLGHSLPVAVVLADTKKKVAYWQIVTEETVQSTRKGWKITIPETNTFSMPAARALAAASEGDVYTLRLRQLQLARPWMEHLVSGGSLAVEFEEWMHKSSGRASLRLRALDENGALTDSHEWPYIFLPGADYAKELPRMFPWATLTRNADADADANLDRYVSECGIWNSKAGELLWDPAYGEWLSNEVGSGIGPAWDDGEVAHWRLDLALSDMGRAFLTVDDHLSNEVIHGLFRN